jgi:phage shock protein A
MGIFGRMKRAVKSKANAAVDKVIDPARELDMAILELESQHKTAMKELLSYKVSAKRMEQDKTSLADKTRTWERRAMTAVKQGDDELARKCLKEKKHCEGALVKLTADRDEAAGYALELNRSRKKVETQLQMLKLKKGTMASQIAAARSGTGSPFGFSNKVFDKVDRAEARIDEDEAIAEAGAALEGESLTDDLEARFRTVAAGDQAGEDDLRRLKAKMEAERQKKLLGK